MSHSEMVTKDGGVRSTVLTEAVYSALFLKMSDVIILSVYTVEFWGCRVEVRVYSSNVRSLALRANPSSTTGPVWKVRA